MTALKETLLRFWPLRWIVLLVLRPKRFKDEFAGARKDYENFRDSVAGFLAYLKNTPHLQSSSDRPGVLLIAGWVMNAQWVQLWSVLGAAYRQKGHTVYALTSKSQPIQNLYFKLFGVRPLYLEDLRIKSVPVPAEVDAKIASLTSFQDVKDFQLNGAPLGKIALSTYSRHRATGIMDIEDPVARREVHKWLRYLYQTLALGPRLYKQHNIGILLFAEVFMEEYGPLYYAALNEELNVIRFAGTVRDNAVVVQHLTRESDRTHFSSISQESWARIEKCNDLSEVERDLQQNFDDRYGDRWALSKRNQPNTKIVPVGDARALLKVPEDRKIAVIYSHILYDTLFFNGEDVFANYADWLVQTVKAACANPNVEWFIKVHPSNLWRGELEHFHGGKYEELRLIEQHVGTLPPHVHYAYPDTVLSPYTWLQLADFGITVRGTSGIELGALGKTVVTAGTGRYENAGFSINPQTPAEYIEVLSRLPDVPPPSKDQIRIGKLFAYATFCMKPFTLDFFKPVPRTGKSKIFSTDDLVFLGNFAAEPKALPQSIKDFVAWSYDRESIDFLSGWSAIVPSPQGGAVAQSAE